MYFPKRSVDKFLDLPIVNEELHLPESGEMINAFLEFISYGTLPDPDSSKDYEKMVESVHRLFFDIGRSNWDKSIARNFMKIVENTHTIHKYAHLSRLVIFNMSIGETNQTFDDFVRPIENVRTYNISMLKRQISWTDIGKAINLPDTSIKMFNDRYIF